MQPTLKQGIALKQALQHIKPAEIYRNKTLNKLAKHFVNSIGIYNINNTDLRIYYGSKPNMWDEMQAEEYVYEMQLGNVSLLKSKVHMLVLLDKFHIICFNNQIHVHLNKLESKPMLIGNLNFMQQFVEQIAKTQLQTT